MRLDYHLKIKLGNLTSLTLVKNIANESAAPC